MMSAKLFGLEAVMLDSIELFANSSRVLLSRVSDALKVRAMDLSTIGKTPTHERLHAILIQRMLIVDFLVAMSL